MNREITTTSSHPRYALPSSFVKCQSSSGAVRTTPQDPHKRPPQQTSAFPRPKVNNGGASATTPHKKPITFSVRRNSSRSKGDFYISLGFLVIVVESFCFLRRRRRRWRRRQRLCIHITYFCLPTSCPLLTLVLKPRISVSGETLVTFFF